MKPIAVPITSAVCLIVTAATGTIAPPWSLLVALASLASIAAAYVSVKRRSEM